MLLGGRDPVTALVDAEGLSEDGDVLLPPAEIQALIQERFSVQQIPGFASLGVNGPDLQECARARGRGGGGAPRGDGRKLGAEDRLRIPELMLQGRLFVFFSF